MPQSAGARLSDLRDIRHVMILMQENRSFDHYFGSLSGVRGFGDQAAIQLPGGLPVWRQPAAAPGPAAAGEPAISTQCPWPLSSGTFEGLQPPSPEAGAQNYGGTDHSWRTQHGAWHGGLMNGWQHAKGGPTTMGFLTRADLPFYYALADAYTIGDAYHCSVLAATGPNRVYLWSGTINADQEHGSFVAHAAADYLGDFLPWECYPVTLQKAGVTWKVYQGSDNYGDNGAQYFATFAELDPSQGGAAPAPGGSVYYDNGLAVVPEPLDYETRNGDNLASAIAADVLAGTLPQVSWVVTNQRYSEPGFSISGGVVTADLALSNSGRHVRKASHFSVYDNTLTASPSIADFPEAFPGQYTVAPSSRIGAITAATGPVNDGGGYDITVVGPNRFLRRFAGNFITAGATAQVTADYFTEGGAPRPTLTLTFANTGASDVTFTVTPANYSTDPASSYCVPAGQWAAHELDPVTTAGGWYDLTVTIAVDCSWSQRYAGHLETGEPSTTG